MSEIKGLSKILEDFTNKETQEFKAITMVVAKEDFFMEIFSKGQITGEIAGGTYVFEILDYSFEKSNGIRKGIYLRCNEKTGDQRLQKILPRMYQVYIDGQMKRGWIKYINKLN